MRRSDRPDFHPQRYDHTGKQFGRWTVLEPAPTRIALGKTLTCWMCKCSCPKGTIRLVKTVDLTRGSSTSCGCVLLEARANRSVPFLAIYNILVRSAEDRNIPVTLTHEEYCLLAQEKLCQYCGNELTWTIKRQPNRASYSGVNVDRKDNTKGYTLENCVPCCGPCNQLKMMLPYDEWLVVIRAINKYRKNTFEISPEHSRIPRTKEEMLQKLYELFDDQVYVRRSEDCEQSGEYTDVLIKGQVDLNEISACLHEFVGQ